MMITDYDLETLAGAMAVLRQDKHEMRETRLHFAGRLTVLMEKLNEEMETRYPENPKT